jgi:hypothetical protein
VSWTALGGVPMLHGMLQRWFCWALLAAFGVMPVCVWAQRSEPVIEAAGPAREPNMDAIYRALRQAQPMGAAIPVENWKLVRQGGEFTFRRGQISLFGKVNGAVTGAVFVGEGSFFLKPKEVREQHSLSFLSKKDSLSADFSVLLMRFSDNSAEEIAAAGKAQEMLPDPVAVRAAVEFANSARRKLHENVALRLLEDVEMPGQSGHAGQFFLASFRTGGALNGRNVLFVVDPEGTPHAKPDQVELSTWSDEGVDTWAAYRMSGAETAPAEPRRITAERLDVSFDKNGTLHGSAEVDLTARRELMRVVPFNLFPTLRVAGVYDEGGQPLDFVQEGKEDDPQFGVVLPKAVRTGERVRVLVKYAGPDAVVRDGEGMYTLVPGARERWYPGTTSDFGDFADFRMTFHLPKHLQIVATGKQVSSEPEAGGGTKAVWVSTAPIAVAGFNLGEFRSGQVKTPAGFTVDAFANEELPDSLVRLSGGPLGTLSTIPALQDELSQGNAAIQIYSNYFGKLPYDHVALTEQSACSFGQSWPMLVYLPMCGFWDQTQLHFLGLLDVDASYWTEVTPHEVAHQWWGQLVGFNSYRDQWMSEGFAHFSVSLFVRNTTKDPNAFRSFWTEQQKHLTEKNEKGLRPVDVGPLTMGYRVNNSKSGDFVAQRLIYAKGAYILHMLEMMYWTPRDGEAPFQQSMQAFVREYSGKAATTEDFKASLEETMPAWLDLEDNGRLDWFFNEYVYGTEIPHYDLQGSFTQESDGTTTAHVKLSQSGVSKDFMMLVPVYLQFQNGKVTRMANVQIHGATTLERSANLGKLDNAPKRLLLNYNGDVLSD